MAEMTEMQVHEERVMNLVESSSGNPTITPLTKTNAHRAESIRRIGTDKDAVAFHFRKKSTGMYMYIHTYTENGEEKELRASDFKNWKNWKKSPSMPTAGIPMIRKQGLKRTSWDMKSSSMKT